MASLQAPLTIISNSSGSSNQQDFQPPAATVRLFFAKRYVLSDCVDVAMTFMYDIYLLVPCYILSCSYTLQI